MNIIDRYKKKEIEEWHYYYKKMALRSDKKNTIRHNKIMMVIGFAGSMFVYAMVFYPSYIPIDSPLNNGWLMLALICYTGLSIGTYDAMYSEIRYLRGWVKHLKGKVE